MNIQAIKRTIKFSAVAAVAGIIGATALQDTASAGSYNSVYKDSHRINRIINSLDPKGWSYKKHYGGYKHYRSIPSYRFKKHYGHNRHYYKKNHTYSYTTPHYYKDYGYDHSYEYRGIDLQVYFARGSNELTWKARRVLDDLGYALTSSRLRHAVYRIAGHTDARGDDYSNQILSEQRARAVKRYLVHKFDINPRRLLTVGFGEERLINTYNPSSSVNRRVEVTLIAKHYSELPYGWYDSQY